MFSKTVSAIMNGIESLLIDVETDVSGGLPYFDLVGYLSGEVKEARERVRTAIRNSNYELEPRRIVVNLSPADIRKCGTSFDLAIACSILSSYRIIAPGSTEDTLIAGELSLSGRVQPIGGVLSMVMLARDNGIHRCIVPAGNALEGAAFDDVQVYGVNSLRETVALLNGRSQAEPVQNAGQTRTDTEPSYGADFSDIRGQQELKRCMEVAAAGMHNILVIGPPGSGKSMAVRRLPTILPRLSSSESIEVSKIYSAAGLMDGHDGLIRTRPFRCPHHTITAQSLAGGGKIPKPGEISLAHKGVLFLDEFTEYDNAALEALRQPLEDGRIIVSRLQGSCTFPADFMLAAAMNPCRCGYFPDRSICRCTDLEIQRYIGRISRPVLDRIDITIYVKPLDISLMQAAGSVREFPAEAPSSGKESRGNLTSAMIRRRVEKAADIQQKRFLGRSYEHNSQIPDRDLDQFCCLSAEEQKFLAVACSRSHITARGYTKILRVARTIADLDNAENIGIEHLAEAFRYKSLDKYYWQQRAIRNPSHRRKT